MDGWLEFRRVLFRSGITAGLTGPFGAGGGAAGRAGFIGMPKSSDASAILRSSVSVLFLLNMDGTPDRNVERMATPQTGSGVRLDARQRLEDVQHKDRGNNRRDEIDERQGEQPRDHHPA